VINKIISMEDAVGFVASESTLALGGMTLYRRPVAFSLALLNRFRESGEPVGLTLLAFTAGYESDLLVGGGLVRLIRSCYFGLEIFGLAPMFTYLANRGEITILEETEASLAFGLRAQMAGIGFMPGRGWMGTDLPALRPDVKTIRDPYSGEELMAFPAIQPDVAVIHALQADPEGNAVLGGNRGVDEELALTARTVIVTAEVIEERLEKADLVSPLVRAVVHAPGGALPTSCHPYYPMDGERLMEYTEKVGEPQAFNRYIDEMLKGASRAGG
jgi:glutaconate CoA-transferase, subunit A